MRTYFSTNKFELQQRLFKSDVDDQIVEVWKPFWDNEEKAH